MTRVSQSLHSQVHFTGHSLGGSISSEVGAKLYGDGLRGIDVYTFNAPGLEHGLDPASYIRNHLAYAHVLAVDYVTGMEIGGYKIQMAKDGRMEIGGDKNQMAKEGLSHHYQLTGDKISLAGFYSLTGDRRRQLITLPYEADSITDAHASKNVTTVMTNGSFQGFESLSFNQPDTAGVHGKVAESADHLKQGFLRPQVCSPFLVACSLTC